MTILFIYDSPLRPEAGGTERATKLVMDELRRKGHRTIGLLHASRLDPNNFFLNGEPINSLSDFLYENQVDVVVNQIAFHDWLLKNFLSHGGQAWKEKGGIIISFMHLDPTPAPSKKLSAYFEDWHKKTFSGKIKRLGLLAYLPFLNHKVNKEYRSSLRFLYEHSDRYVLMSKSFTNIFLKLTGCGNTDKLRFITNMLTFPDIEDVKILEQKEKIVLVVARLDDEQKNISFIIDTWRHISNHRGYRLHIVGDGKDSAKLQKYAEDVDDVVFEKAQSPLSWYQRAKIFLMASPREGWGLTLTESLQCGVVPVVLNTSSVFKDIISNGENGFLAQNRQDYIECLEMLMTDESKCKTMAKNGLESASRFSPAQVGDNWEKLLTEFARI